MEETQNQRPQKPFFPTGGKECAFGCGIALFAMLLVNSILFSGFHLGFAISSIGCTVCTWGYLLSCGCRLTPYTGALLVCSLAISAAYGYSGDGFVKFVLFFFWLMGNNLGLCLLAGQNKRSSGKAGSLADGFRALFSLGIGKLSPTVEGLRRCFRLSGTAGQKSGAVALGLLIALPLLVVVIPLLISADAAFDGLMAQLPQIPVQELILTLLAGSFWALVLYTRGVALRHSRKETPTPDIPRKGANLLTVNTVLGVMCFIYFLYLLSQSAYFLGGFSQILPEGYTVAGYARRGFFEMAALTGVNLCVISVSTSLLRREKIPMSSRLLCLFIGCVSLFLTVTAGAKMYLYVSAYGLTRLRILTVAIILWLALTTVLVTVRLFLPKFGYMKGVMLAAMVIGILLIWTDVDRQVARYNVHAYLSGSAETVDVRYLSVALGDGAVPYLAELAEKAPEAEVAEEAAEALKSIAHYRVTWTEDFRGWSCLSQQAEDILKDYNTPQNKETAEPLH